MTKTYDNLIFIGRFQPFHRGHLSVVRQALEAAKKLVVLCGSARQPVSTRNPWKPVEVEAMIHACLEPNERSRVQVVPLPDVLYNEKRWVRSVQGAVKSLVDAQTQTGNPKPRIGLIGMNVRGEGYYPSRFPQWDAVAVEDLDGIRSTPVRAALFGLNDKQTETGLSFIDSPEAKNVLPEPVRTQLAAYCQTPAYAALCEEAAFLAKYLAGWQAAPYPPTFVTVDAVVVQSGHVLLVERRALPGKGLQALPGGFVRGAETLEEGCLRELREETRLKVPGPVLKGSIKAQQVFDAPYRSQRGRTITHGFLIELAPTQQLPKVKGGDDARRAFWVPLAEVQPERLFEDHYHIIEAMFG